MKALLVGDLLPFMVLHGACLKARDWVKRNKKKPVREVMERIASVRLDEKPASERSEVDLITYLDWLGDKVEGITPLPVGNCTCSDTCAPRARFWKRNQRKVINENVSALRKEVEKLNAARKKREKEKLNAARKKREKRG